MKHKNISTDFNIDFNKSNVIIIYDDTNVGDNLIMTKFLYENDQIIVGEFENESYKGSNNLTCMICKETNSVSNPVLDFYFAGYTLNMFDSIRKYVEENMGKYNLNSDNEKNKFKISIEIEAKILGFDLSLFTTIIENNEILLFYNDDMEFCKIDINRK